MSKNTNTAFEIEMADARFDKILLSATTAPAAEVVRDFVENNSEINLEHSEILIDNALRSGNTANRFLLFKIVNGKIERHSSNVILAPNDKIRQESNRQLSQLTGLLQFSAMSDFNFNNN